MSSVNETASVAPPVAEKSPHDSKTNSRDLPPSRKSQAIRRVSPPLSKLPLNKFIYALALIVVLLIGASYTYQMVQHKRQVGGWWNLAMGKGPIPTVHNQGDGPAVSEWAGDRQGEKHKSCNPTDLTVEERINALAQALGMPSSGLARAIAGAVRHHVPPASLSSIVAKETGEAVRILTNDEETMDGNLKESASTGILGGVVGSVENFVGMDELEP